MSDFDPIYRDIILDLYRHPRNQGILEAPDIDLEDTNPLCGDSIRLTLKIQEGIVTDIAHYGQGCAISQASISLLTDAVKNKTLIEVQRLTAEDVIAMLGIPISHTREKCATLGFTLLQKALSTYVTRN